MADTQVDANPAVDDAQNDAEIVEPSGESSSTAPHNDTKPSTADDMTSKDDVESKTTEPSATSTAARVSPSPPPRPPKRARTAYFIFADSVRSQVQQDHQGVAAQAKAIGAKWQTLNDTEKDKFKQLALQEKEATAKALQEYQEKYGSLLESTATSNSNSADSNDLVFPVARIRKIAKLDPEVKTLSKEALQLVVKSAELALAKLGHESVKVARLENRRTLMASDVAHVCSHREAFRFLKDDIKDLTKALLEQKNANHEADNTKSSKNQAMAEAASGTKPLTSYFGAAKK